MADDKPSLQTLTYLAMTLERLQPDSVCEALDDIVIDAKLKEATEINNGGSAKQLVYLDTVGRLGEAGDALGVLQQRA